MWSRYGARIRRAHHFGREAADAAQLSPNRTMCSLGTAARLCSEGMCRAACQSESGRRRSAECASTGGTPRTTTEAPVVHGESRIESSSGSWMGFIVNCSCLILGWPGQGGPIRRPERRTARQSSNPSTAPGKTLYGSSYASKARVLVMLVAAGGAA